MKHQSRILPFEIKTSAEADEGYSFSGLVAAYRSLDYAGDIFDDGAFARDIEYARAEGKVRDEHHVTTGRITDARDVPGRGLEVDCLILKTQAGKDQYILIKGRAITRMSVGYVALESRYLEGEEAVRAYWESKGYAPTEHDLIMLGRLYCVRLITRARCHEASTTWMPCNEAAVIDSVKSQAGPLAGLAFADHAQAALDAAAEVVQRAEGLRSLRAGDGRTLSTKSLAQLRGLQGQLASLLSATEPTADPADVDRAIFDRYLELETRLKSAGF